MSGKYVSKNNVIDESKIVFFDLEYYVPENMRSKEKKGLIYNPWQDGTKLISMSYIVADPKLDLGKESNAESKIINLSLWNYVDEKDFVLDIYTTLKKIQTEALNMTLYKVSPLLCGIGILNSDIPTLNDLYVKHSILSNEEAFIFQSNFRYLDLSSLMISLIGNSTRLVYPKEKKEIFEYYDIDEKFESGKKVWDMYENNYFSEIINRVNNEVKYTYQCYKEIRRELDYNIMLNRQDKKRRESITTSSI